MADLGIADVGYCGLCCRDCPAGEISNLAARMAALLDRSDFTRVAEALGRMPDLPPEFAIFAEYPTFARVLSAMTELRCERPCRQGGGSEKCRIRPCCQRRGLEGCWRCGEMERCEYLAWLEPMHQGGHLRNLRAIRDKGVEEFLRGPREW